MYTELIKDIDNMRAKNRLIRKDVHLDFIPSEALLNNNVLFNKVKEALRNADKEYERGADDAWELARTVDLAPEGGGYTSNDIEAIFGLSWYEDVFKDYTGTQALAKLKEYEQKKREEEEAAKLKPGDVVEYNGILSKNAIFLYESIDSYWILPSLGHCPQELSKDNWILKKTGKHVDLEGLFEEMQEG